MSLGNQIKKYRQKLDWTLEKLEEESGVPRGTISALEVRDSDRSKYAQAIAKAFGITVEQLMDKDFDASDAIQTHEQNKIDSEYVIRQFDARGSMGTGIILQEQTGIIENFRVTSGWLQENIKGYSTTKNLCVVTGFGESMTPLFNNGDPVIIDLSIKEYVGAFPYFFRVGDEGFIKRLQKIPGIGIRALSDNPKYEPWTIPLNMDFEILGRVIKVWKSEDF